MSDEKKKRKFLTKKFNGSISNGRNMALGHGAGNALFLMTAPFDMGATVLAVGCVAITTSLVAGLADNKRDIVSYKNNAGQDLKAPEWVSIFHKKLEKQLIKTQDRIAQYAYKGKKSKNKKYDQLVAKKAKLLDVARDLEDYITVINEDGKTLKSQVIYVIKEPTGDLAVDRNHMIDSSGKVCKPARPKPKAFKL